MSIAISSGRPRQCAIVRTYAPYLIFDTKCDTVYTTRIKYISKNAGRTADGLSEVVTIANASELPNIQREFHELVFLKAAEMIAADLAMVTNGNGTPRYPGAMKTAEAFKQRYVEQLLQDTRHARRREIDRGQAAFKFGGI